MVRAGSLWQLPVRMNILLDEIDVLETSGDPAAVEVSGIEHDSRRVVPGALFCCLVGHETDGHDHAAEAVERGAVGLVCERALPEPVPSAVVQARVPPGRGRPAMARLAAAFWGHPSESLLTAGVTGTNGKTTVTHVLGAILTHAGHPTTVIGTLSGARTTPEAPELQRILAEVRDGNPPHPRPAVAMEVSSHALVQSRVDGVHFDVAAFTNLSHDHLDFHGSMEEYFAAKASMFEPGRAAQAVIDVDDPWGARLFDRVRIDAVPVRLADVTDLRLEVGRSQFRWRDIPVTTPLTGLVNVRNAQLAAETAVALGVSPEVVAAGLATVVPVPGRLERVTPVAPHGPAAEVLVDYAHTPAALEAVLDEARRLAAPGSGRTIVVFGCGGDRDPFKRPVMGTVAARKADLVVVTSDNPRSEDPDSIIAAVVAGAPAPAAPVVEPDRRAAIVRAVAAARPGDVVVVAGKGHETYQEAGGHRVPFDDRVVAAAAHATAAAAAASAAPSAPSPSAPGAAAADGQDG
jgi:UDP-N-acetylmuramoyl-L-alanyl-D-glutamate--2,6-diaminopimelate ligase